MKLQNGHSTDFREVLYPWHPWLGYGSGFTRQSKDRTELFSAARAAVPSRPRLPQNEGDLRLRKLRSLHGPASFNGPDSHVPLNWNFQQRSVRNTGGRSSGVEYGFQSSPKTAYDGSSSHGNRSASQDALADTAMTGASGRSKPSWRRLLDHQ